MNNKRIIGYLRFPHSYDSARWAVYEGDKFLTAVVRDDCAMWWNPNHWQPGGNEVVDLGVFEPCPPSERGKGRSA